MLIYQQSKTGTWDIWLVSSGGLYCNRGNCFWWGRGGGTSHPCCNFDGRCALWEVVGGASTSHGSPAGQSAHHSPRQLGNQSSNLVGIHQWIPSSQIHQPFFRGCLAFWPRHCAVPSSNPENRVHFSASSCCEPDFISIWPGIPAFHQD